MKLTKRVNRWQAFFIMTVTFFLKFYGTFSIYFLFFYFIKCNFSQDDNQHISHYYYYYYFVIHENKTKQKRNKKLFDSHIDITTWDIKPFFSFHCCVCTINKIQIQRRKSYYCSSELFSAFWCTALGYTDHGWWCNFAWWVYYFLLPRHIISLRQEMA